MKIRENLMIALAAVALIWAVYLLDLVLPLDLRMFGLRPRRLDGLWGLVFAPFLHGGLRHLTANSGALFVLLAISLSFDRKSAILALAIIALGGGGLVWLFGGGNTVHIGASGVIFGLIGFLLFTGIFQKNVKALAVSAAVFLLYGGVLLALFRYVPGVSWTGHFFGFLSGVLAARLTKNSPAKE